MHVGSAAEGVPDDPSGQLKRTSVDVTRSAYSTQTVSNVDWLIVGVPTLQPEVSGVLYTTQLVPLRTPSKQVVASTSATGLLQLPELSFTEPGGQLPV